VTEAAPFKLALSGANWLAVPSFAEVWKAFFRAATKFKQEHKKIPVLIIDNANRLSERQQKLLDHIQDYATLAVDKEIATVVFVSSECRVPRRMMGMSILSVLPCRFEMRR